MQNKGAIRLFAILIGLACIYQLSFTFIAKNVEKKAAAYAAQLNTEEIASADAIAADTLRSKAESHYLDSVRNQPVFNLFGREFTYKDIKERELNLGLDLKGGMNVMLEIQVQDVIKALAGDNKNNEAFVAAMQQADEKLKAGSGNYVGDFVEAFEKNSTDGVTLAQIFANPDRTDITLQSENSDIEKMLKRETEAAIDASFNVLRSRIDHFGVAQPNIMRLPNSHRILIELPGVKEPERVRKLLQGTASLEFWTTYNAQEVMSYLSAADAALKARNDADKATEKVEAEKVEATEETVAEGSLVDEVAAAGTTEVEAEATPASRFTRENNPLFTLLNPDYAGGASIGAAFKEDMTTINALLADPEIAALFPGDISFKWSVKGKEAFDGRYQLYAIKVENPNGKAPLDGSFVTDAIERYSQNGATAEVSMSMNAEGVRRWGDLTGDNVGRCIAIVLDNNVYSAPVVNGRIDGESQISGDFDIQEARDLANVLKSGKVPAPATIIQDTVVGPSLGQDSINAGLLSFAIAFVLVLLYMGLYYKTAGWICDVALLFNVFLLVGVLVSFGAVLTLPGIAGIVLTMGMAVDANVIIYERIKEELKAGKGLSLAIQDGFSNALSAIIDGNLTTIITGIVLFTFGTGPVQGFATTLIIGILTSMFTAIFISRMMIEKASEKFHAMAFSRKWSDNLLSNVNIDFLKKRKSSYIVVAVALALSIVSLATLKLNLGAEFTGGRAYVVRFDQNVVAEEVRANIEAAFAQTTAEKSAISCEVKQYGNENQMRIVTQYKYDDTSKEATAEVNELLFEALKEFYGYEISLEAFTTNSLDKNGIISSDKIGPSIASDMTWNSIWSVLLSLVAIGLYITFRFRRWQWALGATAALAINVTMVIGIFSLLYKFMPFNLEVNQAFIAAILTIIGYAINDTVVVFDRIRENLGLHTKRSLRENVNNAVNATLTRTLNTSGTTLVTLLAIFFLGGETIRGFIFALILGVVIGTAATIFVATPIAYDLMKNRK